MSESEENRKLITRFWDDLYRGEYAAVGAYFAADGRYEDVPVPDGTVIGPAGVERKLRIGLGRIESHVHHLHRIVASGDTVMTEHTEDWHFDADHCVSLPFVSVHVIDGGKIALWRDYWNFDTLMSGAPAWWVEHITSAWAQA